jgi:hypothetical protein
MPGSIPATAAASVNWFFWGHANKLSFDVSRLGLDRTSEPDLVADTRYRAQWDIPF